jgi:hypothetical protein
MVEDVPTPCPQCGHPVEGDPDTPRRCSACAAEVPAEVDATASVGAGGPRAERGRPPFLVPPRERRSSGGDRAWERMVDGMLPVPWDERDRTAFARALDTVLQLSARPEHFFRSMATDRDGGATRLAVASIVGASIGIAWVLTGFVIAAGTTVPPLGVAFEVMLTSAALMMLLGGFRAAVVGLVLRFRQHRLRGVRRVAAFAAAPMLLGVVPVVGLIAGVVLGARAFATGLRVRFGFSRASAWALALLPGPALLVAITAVVAALTG